jgi:organic radical activating enzyme
MPDSSVHSFVNLTSDVPGYIGGTLLFQGCNLRCPFCFNKELMFQGFFPAGHYDQILKEILSHPYQGIAFGGGEPLLYQRELVGIIMNDIPEVWRKAVYTNFTESIFPGLFDLVDYWFVSLKPRSFYTTEQWRRLTFNLGLYGLSPKVRLVEVEGHGLTEQLKYVDPKGL